MPLVLTFRVGEDFFVADRQFHLISVDGPQAALIASATEDFELTDTHAVEIFPGCRASLSERCTNSQARIAFDAPRAVTIASGDKVRSGSTPKVSDATQGGRAPEPTVAPTAIANATAIGLKGDVQTEILNLLRLSAPVTHERGNRRFEDFIFNVVGDVVRAVYRLNEHERDDLDNRGYQQRRKMAEGGSPISKD